MKSFVKQYYQEYVDNINFPTIIYVYETGKVAAFNRQALEMLGKTVTNVNKIRSSNPTLAVDKELLDNGNQIFYNQRFYAPNSVTIEIDCDVSSVHIDDFHMIVVFFDYSFKQLFSRHNKYMMPRIFWVDKKRTLMGCNETFRSDIHCNENGTLPKRIDEVLDEDSASKIAEDCGKVLSGKEPLYNMLQLVKPINELGYFCKINRIPLYNKNGTVVGVISVYTLIFNREEYERFYIDTLRENNILNRVICMTDTIVISFRKDIVYMLDYVSSNVSKFGYTADECYNGKIDLRDLISDAAIDSFFKNVHEIETGTEDYFNQTLQVQKADQTYMWVNIHVCISKRNAYNYYFECFMQELQNDPMENGEEEKDAFDLAIPKSKSDVEKNKMHCMEKLCTYYQPIIDPLTYCMIGVESILSWKSASNQIVDPKEVLTTSEYLAILEPLSEYYIESSIKAFVKMKKHNKSKLKLYISLTSWQLIQINIIQMIRKSIREADVSPDEIVVEVNESLAIESHKFMQEILNTFKVEGYTVALNYYGAGGGNIDRILALPIDVVKLDKELMNSWQSKDIDPNEFIDIIDTVNLSGGIVIVKGVETKKQLEYLMFQDIFAFQGNYFGIPRNFDDIIKQIKEMNV